MKTSVSLYRHRQFAVITAASAKRVRLGIRLKSEAVSERLVAGDAMCSRRVDLSYVDDVVAEVLGWLLLAYDRN